MIKLPHHIVSLLISLIFFSSHTSLSAQLLDSLALDTTYTFTDLNKALSQPEKVIKLDLSKQKLDSFPSEIIRFKNLQYLNLKRTRLKILPDDLCMLTNLQYLNISKNKIEHLPKCIGNLTHLKHLIANQNFLIDLPESIGNLTQLETLDLWSNELSEFPETMQKLIALRFLDLRVINLTPREKEYIRSLLPETTKIYFSNGCSCGF